MEGIRAYKDISTLFCPTCHKPRDVIGAGGDGFVVLRCLNCDTALAWGIFASFSAIAQSTRKPFFDPKPKRQLPREPLPGVFQEPKQFP